MTFDLGGHTYSLNKYSSNRVGTVENTTLVTFTNGTIRRLDALFTGNTLDERFYLQGPGSTLFLRNALHNEILYYFWMDPNTSIVIDGPDAKLVTIGASQQTAGSIIVTNGGFLNAAPGLRLTASSSVHVSGPGYRALFAFSGMHEDSVVLMDKGASVQNGHSPTFNKVYHHYGTVTLEDVRWYEWYLEPTRGWRSFDGEKALLQGTGSVETQRIIMNGGTIRPGCAGQAGLLTFTGHITNAVPSSVLDMELGGSTMNDYDRIRVVGGSRGSGTLYAGGILNVTAINGYEPERATTFNLIDAVEIVSEFDTVALPDWIGEWDMSELYTAGAITFFPHFGTTILIQ